MIISVRQPDRIIRRSNGDTINRKSPIRYWKWMNNGKPVCSSKFHAAHFDGDVLDKAFRQVKILYPLCEVSIVNPFEEKNAKRNRNKL